MQRGALLDAARSLLSEGGTEALTFPALAERTGLARSSVYEYFRSRAAVVEELCAVDFPVWAAEVEVAMDGAETPRARSRPMSASSWSWSVTGATVPSSPSRRASSTTAPARRSARHTAASSP